MTPATNINEPATPTGRAIGVLDNVMVNTLRRSIGPHRVALDVGDRVWIWLHEAEAEDCPEWLLPVTDGVCLGRNSLGHGLWSVPADRCWFITEEEAEDVIAAKDEELLTRLKAH